MSASPGSILAGMRFFAWLFPPTPLKQLTESSFDELRVKFKGRDFWCNGFGGFLCFLLIAGIYFVLIMGLEDWILTDVPKERFMGPIWIIDLLLAMFLSLFCGGYVMTCVLRCLLDSEEYELYMAYLAEQGRHSKSPMVIHFGKLFALFFWCIGLPLHIVTLGYLDTYTSFSEQNVRWNAWWSWGTEIVHPYTDVEGVYEVENVHLRFEDKYQPYQVILFTNGTRWETENGHGGDRLETERELMRFVAQKSGKIYKPVKFAEDLPAPNGKAPEK